MRLLGICLAVLAASAAAAQEPEPPDFTREGLQRSFAARAIDLPERPKPNVRVGFGVIEFRAFSMDWRIAFLPILPPLHGSAPTTTNMPPDPFLLTGTAFATPPRSWRTQRSHAAELKRIEKSGRSRLELRSQ